MGLFLSLMGWAGTTLVILAYFLMIQRYISSIGTTYYWLNLAGSILLGISLARDNAWSGTVLQIVWGVLAIQGLLQARRIKKGISSNGQDGRL